MKKPAVVILCPKEFRFTDLEASIERPFLADVADLNTVWLDFNAPFPDEVLAADALILWHGPLITAGVIARLKHCRVIVRNGVGFDSVDIEAAAAAGIPVCNVPDYGTEEVADHALALTLALYRQLFPLDAEAKQLGWKIKVAPKMRRLRTQTFGIVGLGRIGTAAALRAKAFGFRVVFYDPHVPAGTHKAVGVERANSLAELFKQSDTVSVHCPLSAKTRGMIGAGEIALMKPGSFIVNTARGDIVQRRPCLRRCAADTSRARASMWWRTSRSAPPGRPRRRISSARATRPSAVRKAWSKCAAPRPGSPARRSAENPFGIG